MINRPLAIVLANFKSKWNPGWDVSVPSSQAGKDRVLLLNSTTGDVQMRDVLDTRRIDGNLIWRKNFGVKTDAVLFFSLRGKEFLLQSNSTSGKVKISPITADGELDSPVFESTWSSGWKNLDTYKLNGQLYLVIVKPQTGDIHIHKIDSGGKVGTRTLDTKFSSSWDIATTYVIADKAFLFLLNSQNGKVEIYELDDGGKIVAKTKSYKWSSGWDIVRFYSVGSEVFLFLLKSSTGQVHIQKMNGDGKVGARTFTNDWSSGWDSVMFYSSGSKTCLSLVKSSTGQGHLHEMDTNGKVGERINPREPFTKEFMQEQFTISGKGKSLMYDYFSDISRGEVSIDGSFVTDWVTIPDSWENVKENLNRGGKAIAAMNAARDKGYEINNSQSVVAIHSQPGDSGASGRYVLSHPHRLTLEFFGHEILHSWDLGHAYSDDTSIAGGWGNELAWGEYDNPWDIMSALNAIGFDNGLNTSVGPGLNIFGLDQLGWLKDNATSNLYAGNLIESVLLNSLSLKSNTTNLGVKVHYALGEYYTVEHHTKDEWDFGFDGPQTLIHRVEASTVPRNQQWRGNLGKDWNNLHVFRVNGKSFLLRMKSATGEVVIDGISENAKLLDTVFTSKWSTGWTTVESYSVGNTTFLFLLKESTGDVHIHKMNADGTVGAQVSDLRWSAGWTSAQTFKSGNKTFLFLLKKDVGEVHIHELNLDGKVGKEVKRNHWSSGWSKVQFYYQQSNCFLLIYKEASGEVHTHKMNNDGTVGVRIDTTSWGNDWDTVDSYGMSATQIIRMQSSTGFAYFQSTNSNGNLVDVHEKAKLPWSPGWTNAVGFGTRSGLYMLIYKKETGRSEFVLMSKARVLRKQKSDDPNRPPIQMINENGVSIKVINQNVSNKTAIVEIS